MSKQTGGKRRNKNRMFRKVKTEKFKMKEVTDNTMKEVTDNTKWHKTNHKEDRQLWVYFQTVEGMKFAQENRKVFQASLYATCDFLDNRTPEEEAVTADVKVFPKGIHIGGVMNDVFEAFADMRSFMGP